MSAISIQDRLVYVMVTISAVDKTMSEEEMLRIGNIVKHLPVFDGYSSDQLVNASKTCRDILQEDEGLATVLGLAAELPKRLQVTAYGLAAESAAADRNVAAEEVRLLQMLRARLGLDRLTAAALELAAHARHQSAHHERETA